MSIWRILKYLRAFFIWGLFIFAGSFLIVRETVDLILQESRFHRLYGDDWVQVYQKYEEPLSRSNFKIGLGVAYVLVLCGFLYWLYLRFASKKSRRSRRRG